MQSSISDCLSIQINGVESTTIYKNLSEGLYTAVRGTAETISALSDLYLDTETLDNVQKALPEMSLDDIYGEDAGGVAKFTSLLTQYGTGFAVAQKIAKKLFGNVAKTKLAQKATAVAATNKAANYGCLLYTYPSPRAS